MRNWFFSYNRRRLPRTCVWEPSPSLLHSWQIEILLYLKYRFSRRLGRHLNICHTLDRLTPNQGQYSSGCIRNLRTGVHSFYGNLILHPHFECIVYRKPKIQGCITVNLKIRGCGAPLSTHPLYRSLVVFFKLFKCVSNWVSNWLTDFSRVIVRC